MNAYQQLETHFKEIAKLNYVEHILIWDEAVMMPVGSGAARADAIAAFKAVQHERLAQPRLLDLVQEAQQIESLSEWQKANLYWIEKNIRRHLAVPIDLLQEKTKTTILCEQAWRRYREENNWHDFSPYLEKTFSLVKEAAEHQAKAQNLSTYDSLIDEYCPGMKQQSIDPIFNLLKNALPPLIDSITANQRDPITLPEGPFPIEQQQAIAKRLMQAIGFDFMHGRLDTSHHPFCRGIPEDTRITTRYQLDEFSSALLGICHETGHALYDQALPSAWRDQPVGLALGMAVHESQSLIIEMEACHSKAFMHFFSAQLTKTFGSQKAFEVDNLYRLHTQVQPSLIRVDADEVTYPLHVILRYEIEKDLFSGKINIQDLPEIWDDKMSHSLGISTKNNFKDGVMQDVHWPSGTFGYFPAYTLGRLMASQFFYAAKTAEPKLESQLNVGNFKPLKNWLNQQVHTYGSSLSVSKLLQTATGETLNPNYFLRHVEQRYGVVSTVNF